MSEDAALAEVREERDALQEEVRVLRACVSAQLHASWQEKANAYAALRAFDRRRQEAAKKGGGA